MGVDRYAILSLECTSFASTGAKPVMPQGIGGCLVNPGDGSATLCEKVRGDLFQARFPFI